MKSLLIEINEGLEMDMLLVEEIKKSGLRLRHKKRAEMFDGTKFSKIYNYIFERS